MFFIPFSFLSSIWDLTDIPSLNEFLYTNCCSQSSFTLRSRVGELLRIAANEESLEIYNLNPHSQTCIDNLLNLFTTALEYADYVVKVFFEKEELNFNDLGKLLDQKVIIRGKCCFAVYNVAFEEKRMVLDPSLCRDRVDVFKGRMKSFKLVLQKMKEGKFSEILQKDKNTLEDLQKFLGVVTQVSFYADDLKHCQRHPLGLGVAAG